MEHRRGLCEEQASGPLIGFEPASPEPDFTTNFTPCCNSPQVPENQIVDTPLMPQPPVNAAFTAGDHQINRTLLVAGLHLEVTQFDSDPMHIAIGTIVEAAVFWILGYLGATVYNYFAGISRK